MIITIDLERQDFIDGLEDPTPKNIEYINDNYKEMIDNEIEMLEMMITEGDFNTASVINDNRGEMNFTNDDGEEMGTVGYYAEVKL